MEGGDEIVMFLALLVIKKRPLLQGLVALPYYRETNPELAANARFRIGQVLAG